MNKEINRPLLRAAYLVPFLIAGMPFGVAAAIPATPLITEHFVNKSGVLGMAWNPVAGAASIRVQVSNLMANGCKLDAATSSTCFVNRVVALNGPLNPAANTGVSVASYNGGNIYARLVAVDATGKQMSFSAWVRVPHYLGLTSGGKAWPLASVEPGRALTVSASIANGSATMAAWVFDVAGNMPEKSHSGINFTVTPMAILGGSQTWVLKSRSQSLGAGLVVDSGVVNVSERTPLVYKIPAKTGTTHPNCEPQCVKFVVQNSGLPGGHGNANAYVGNVIPGFGPLERNGTSFNKPKPGDILVWDKGTFGHVALVERVNLATGQLTRVATNEDLRCGFSKVVGGIGRSSSGAYTISWTDAAKNWGFVGWRPKL